MIPAARWPEVRGVAEVWICTASIELRAIGGDLEAVSKRQLIEGHAGPEACILISYRLIFTTP